MQKYNHIFFSAHLDDVIGSCGQTISKLLQSGERICVVTIFAGDGGHDLSAFAKRLHTRWKIEDSSASIRRQEDISACKCLGVDFKHLNFSDAIYRKSENNFLYTSSVDLFSKIHNVDLNTKKSISKKILSIIKNNSATLYFPMGFGGHVDHKMLHDVGLNILKQDCNKDIRFYRDFSYRNKFSRIPAYSFSVKSSKEHLQNKINAFNKYKSQISTLFGTIDNMYKYFVRFKETFYTFTDITVITVSRGRSQIIDRAIRSVRKQTIFNRIFHLIIIDDCVDTLRFLEQKYNNDHKIKWIYVARNTKDTNGPVHLAKLRNFAIRNTRTKWVSMLDDDNEYEPKHLQYLFEFAAKTNFDLVHSWHKKFFWDGKPFLEKYWPYNKDKNEQKAKYIDYVRRGILQPGSNIVKDGFDNNTIDTSVWLTKTKTILNYPYPENISKKETINNMTEDKKFYQSIVNSGLAIGCNKKTTMRYYLGGYSTEFNTVLNRGT